MKWYTCYLIRPFACPYMRQAHALAPSYFVQISKTYILCSRMFNFLWEPFIHESDNAVRTSTRSHHAKPTSHFGRKLHEKIKENGNPSQVFYSLLHRFSLLNRWRCGCGCCTSPVYMRLMHIIFVFSSATWFWSFSVGGRRDVRVLIAVARITISRIIREIHYQFIYYS